MKYYLCCVVAQGTEVEVGVPVLDLTRFVVWDVTNEILRQCPVFLRLEVLQSMPANFMFKTPVCYRRISLNPLLRLDDNL